MYEEARVHIGQVEVVEEVVTKEDQPIAYAGVDDLRGTVDSGWKVDQDTSQARAPIQECGEHVTKAAADIGYHTNRTPVERLGQRATQLVDLNAHGTVEHSGHIGTTGQILPEWQTKNIAPRRSTGDNRGQQVLAGLGQGMTRSRSGDLVASFPWTSTFVPGATQSRLSDHQANPRQY